MCTEGDDGPAALALEHEKARYSTLVNRSGVLDSRAGTLLSTLVIVGGVIGAFWAFALEKESAATVEQLASDLFVQIFLLALVVFYALTVLLLGGSLLVSVYLPTSDNAAPTEKRAILESARSAYYDAVKKTISQNDLKRNLLGFALATFAVALVLSGAFAGRVLFLISPEIETDPLGAGMASFFDSILT